MQTFSHLFLLDKVLSDDYRLIMVLTTADNRQNIKI